MKIILTFILFPIIFLNGETKFTEAELIERAESISSRIVPTKLKYHQLKQMWFKGDEYCLSKPEIGVGEYEGIYVQLLLDKVSSTDGCSFDIPAKQPFILDMKSRILK